MSPKYSIIIPVHNVIKYLPATINSIVAQDYDDYEIIISDDHSTDGTADYIDTLNKPNIKALHTPHRFTVPEHFDWALSHATGTWCMFVGGDDGLQPYFFTLADRLTAIADKNNIRAIASRRAYYFWNGCQSDYGDQAVSYSAMPNIYICDSKKEALKALYEKKSYFELPQMYTTSLFHTSLIREIREKQNGKFLTYGISDANMAALSTLFEKKYLYSEIPLGWIGTSPKVLTRPADFITSTNKKMPIECGDYRLGSQAVYFWGALLTVCSNLQYNRALQKLKTKTFILKLAAYEYRQLKIIDRFRTTEKYNYFIEFLKLNNLNIEDVEKKTSQIIFCNYIDMLLFFLLRCIRYLLKRIPFVKNNFEFYADWTHRPDMTMEIASEIIMEMIDKNMNFSGLKL